jgi:lactate permease
MTLPLLLLKTLLSIIPIALIYYLLVYRKTPTHYGGLWGWVATMIIARFFFDTPLEVGLKASVQGVLQSFPISVMILFSLLQVTFMECTGAIARIAVFLKTLAPGNKEAQIMMLNLSAGTTLVSVGATPVSVLPPILRGLGYSNRNCIALPALGFDALCTYAMMAAPLVIYCDLTKVGLVEAAKVFSSYLPVISTLICFSMFWLAGGWRMVRKGFASALLIGLTVGGTAYVIAHVSIFNSAIILTGVIAGVISILVMLIFLKLKGSVIIDRSVLTEEDKAIEKTMSMGAALSPWLILIACLLIVTFVPPVDKLLRIALAMPVAVIPGTAVKIRPLWNAYFWVLVSTFLSMLILRPTGLQVKDCLQKWGKRAPKPFFSGAVFFMLGLLMNYTGFQVGGDGKWALLDAGSNMISVLADATTRAFGHFYSLMAAPLGLFGGFITSSEASALAMFAKYNILTAQNLKLNALVITAATGIAAGLASVISPVKLQNAAAIIDCMGEENAVIRDAFKISLVLMAAVAVMCFLLS